MAFPSWNQDFDRAPERQTILPSVPDRLLAFLIDCLIFFPVIGLVVAGEVKHLKILTLMNGASETASRAGVLLIFEVMVLAICLEALFVRFNQGTPGQRFLQMRVVNWPDGKPLDFMQALQRAALWWVGMVTVLPMFSIYTNSLRRAFHDRATDTLVASDRLEGDTGPNAGEKALFRSWTRLAFVIFLLLSVTAFFDLRNRLHRPELLHEMAALKELDCPALLEEGDSLRRLDLGMTLFRLGALKKECLERESDRAAWSTDPLRQAMGFLAKSYLPETHTAAAYRERVCVVAPESEACSIVGFLSSTGTERGDLLRRKGLTMLSSRLHLLEDSLNGKAYLSAAALLDDLSRDKTLAPHMERMAMKTLWGMSQAPASSRAPAAATEWEQVQTKLRKRLDLP